MWFADVGVWLACAVLAGWAVLLVVTVVARLRTRHHPGPPARPTARLLLIGGGATAVLFALQAGVVDTVEDAAGTGVPDQSVWSWFLVHRTPSLTPVTIAVTTAGGTVPMAVLAVLGALVLVRARRGVEAAALVVATVGASGLVTGFKSLYGRGRPPLAQQLTVETNPALPSGHALGSTVVLGMLAAIVVLLARHRAVRVSGVAGAAAGIAAIGVSRLYLGVHWLTDVVTGWLLGGTWLAVCVTALVLLRHQHAHDHRLGRGRFAEHVRRMRAAPSSAGRPGRWRTRSARWRGGGSTTTAA